MSDPLLVPGPPSPPPPPPLAPSVPPLPASGLHSRLGLSMAQILQNALSSSQLPSSHSGSGGSTPSSSSSSPSSPRSGSGSGVSEDEYNVDILEEERNQDPLHGDADDDFGTPVMYGDKVVYGFSKKAGESHGFLRIRDTVRVKPKTIVFPGSPYSKKKYEPDERRAAQTALFLETQRKQNGQSVYHVSFTCPFFSRKIMCVVFLFFLKELQIQLIAATEMVDKIRVSRLEASRKNRPWRDMGVDYSSDIEMRAKQLARTWDQLPPETKGDEILAKMCWFFDLVSPGIDQETGELVPGLEFDGYGGEPRNLKYSLVYNHLEYA